MRFGSCFAGIGGFDLGLEAAGMEPVWQIELSEYGRSVLARHWPDVARFDDIRSAPMRVLAGVDLICGGFPCQDISCAGQQAGLEGEQSRLWFDMARIIEAVRPRWIVVENSPALRTRGADEILWQLEELGYACWPLVVGAWAVGARHRRDRVWLIGQLDNTVLERPTATTGGIPAGWNATKLSSELVDAGIGGQHSAGSPEHRDVEPSSELANACVAGQQGLGLERILDPIRSPYGCHTDRCNGSLEHPESSGLEGRGKRLPRRWPAGPVEPQAEWEPPRTVECKVGRGVNGFPARLAERRRKRELETLGAAVVPQVAEAIGRAILRVDRAERLMSNQLTSDLDDIR